ncbi:MAG: metallophosphoesterase [Clostridia bacterium]|nr:metallophosphoesterase [Clostridia bacterium]
MKNCADSSVDIFNKIRFTVFADLHYKKGMYISSVSDIRQITDRAHRDDADFVIHVGDLCNDYLRSVELTDAYLHNSHSLPAYGVYGNHELESRENSMEYVTERLCNRHVVWGTPDGERGDGNTGYYFFDINGFRVVGLDTNYSFDPDSGVWEHNRTASWGAPSDNIRKDSLGDVQLTWLEGVLRDAAERGLSCLLFSHVGFSGVWYSSPDTGRVQQMIRHINKERSGTVLMSVSGHLHTDHQALIDGVVHFDVNTVRNGLWLPEGEEHYGDMTYAFVDYDCDGKETARYDRPLSDAWMSKQTWFFDRPLSATVTVEKNAGITVKGSETSWYGGVEPEARYGVRPRISDGIYLIKEDHK